MARIHTYKLTEFMRWTIKNNKLENSVFHLNN